MTKIRLLISFLILLFGHMYLQAQKNYPLEINCIDKPAGFATQTLLLKQDFASLYECRDYTTNLLSLLQSKGYITASIDTIRFDSSKAVLVLFAGDMYKWKSLDTKKTEPGLLDAIGWNEKQFSGNITDLNLISQSQEKILTWYENNGYPFAKVYFDSIHIEEGNITAQLKTEKGGLYKIDSIRIFGTEKIANGFFQRYLDMPNGSIYSKQKLKNISSKVQQLDYVEEEQPFDISYLATGAVVNLYLKNRKRNRFNVLIGVLPNNNQLADQKTLITGEADINLKNALGGGETIGLQWQTIQPKSPRLNIVFRQPYIFNSAAGLDFTFDMLKKDSSFLNINAQIGARYNLSNVQSGKIFLQLFQTVLSEGGINKVLLLQTRRLPDVADVSYKNLGLQYEVNKTNYRLNPRKGIEWTATASAGTKKLKKNNTVAEFKDPSDPSFDFATLYDTVKLKTYQFRLQSLIAKYLPVGRQSTIKTALNTGIFQSGNIFRNELFQLGGYKTLRGFDEESQYLTQYAFATVEYRLFVSQNSYFNVFADGGWGKNKTNITNINYSYIGTGLGLAIDAKAGIFNLAAAVGKRNDDPGFNLRRVKIHLGFVSYF
jgi:outer membrane protein assembly factor BamA